MTKEILFQIISALYKINYTVVAITSDLGKPKNMGLWSELSIDYRLSDKLESTKYFFQHPESHLKDFCRHAIFNQIITKQFFCIGL